MRICSSTRAWLRSTHRLAPVGGDKLVRSTTTLRTELPAVAAAQGAGTLSLARVGRRLAEIVDPAGVQSRDEKPILDDESDAHRDRDLTLSSCRGGAGGTLRARLDALGYALMSAYLSAATAPDLMPPPASETGSAASQLGNTPLGDSRRIGQRRHDAVIEAVRQVLEAGGLPSSGGVKPRIVVTIPYESLLERTGAGRLADGTLISPSGAAPGRAATGRFPGARHIMWCLISTAGVPASETACCSACSTITRSRTATGPSPSTMDGLGSPRPPGSIPPEPR